MPTVWLWPQKRWACSRTPSNHYHIVLTDPHARLPEFTAYLHKRVAKCVNASIGRWENLWSSEKPSTSTVKLENADDVMKRVVYVA